MNPHDAPFYGKYRGQVVRNRDPERRGRIMVTVPSICTDAWAMPCTPFAGVGLGVVVVPPVRAAVWVEFEAGDPSKPIVVGYFWENPISSRLEPGVEIAPGELNLRCGDNRVRISAAGIEIESSGVAVKVDAQAISAQCGSTTLQVAADGVNIAAGASTAASVNLTQVKLNSAVVSINDGALQVI